MSNNQHRELIEVKAYKCPACRKVYQRKACAEKHLEVCQAFKENRPLCGSCAHCERVQGAYFDDYGNEHEFNTDVCTKKNIVIINKAQANKRIATIELYVDDEEYWGELAPTQDCEYYEKDNQDVPLSEFLS